MKISAFALVIFLTFSVGNSAFAQIYTDEDAFNEEEKNFLIEFIMNTMDSIFNLVFGLAEDQALQQWSDKVIDNMAQKSLDTINSQQGYVP